MAPYIMSFNFKGLAGDSLLLMQSMKEEKHLKGI